MSNRVGIESAGSVISIVTTSLKEYTKKIVPPELWLSIINSKVDMINAAMGTLQKSVYKDKVILTDPAGTKGGEVVTETDGIVYTNSTRNLYIPSANFGAGKFSTSITSCLLLPVGTLISVHEHVGGNYPFYFTEIESIVDSQNVILKSALGKDFSNTTSDANFMFIAPNTSEMLNIGSAAWYKQIDQILSIYDSALDDECLDAETVSNFYSMRKSQMGDGCTYRKSIIWVRDSEYLMFARGTGLTAYGTRTLHYTRLPYSCTLETDLVDIPKSMLDLLYSLCMLAGLQRIQVPIPTELKSAESQIAVMKAAKEEEIAKLLANKGD